MANQKMKTKRAAAKRFKVTGTGKLKRNKAYKSHILTKKTTKRKRNLRKSALVDETNVKTMKKIMEKNKYIQPEISICHVETDQMMACSGPSRFDSPADEHIDVLTNMEKFTDIWGNEL